MASEPTIYSVLPGIVAATVNNEIVAIDMESGRYIGLRGAAIPVWDGLQQGATREQLLRRVLATYEVDEERAAADLDGLLADLEARGIAGPQEGG